MQPGAPSRLMAGASLIEYVLLLALIAVVCFVGLQVFGEARNNSLSRSGSVISGVAP